MGCSPVDPLDMVDTVGFPGAVVPVDSMMSAAPGYVVVPVVVGVVEADVAVPV